MARRTQRARFSPDETAERKRRDEELLEAAEAAMEDADGIGARYRDALDLGICPRLLRYSVQNFTMILDQAAARGIPLTDVETFVGWTKRGRVPRGPGLRITKPVGDDKAANTGDGGAADPASGPGGESGGKKPRMRFRMFSVFDISQTVRLDQPDADPDATPGECDRCQAPAEQPCRPGCDCTYCAAATTEEQAGEPGDILWNSLYDQTVRAGYRFDWPAEAATLGERLAVADHDTATLHVARRAAASDPEALAAVAAALTEILTRPREPKTLGRRALTP